jgi:hypothetical protein
MVFLEWMTQLWVECSGVGGGTSHGHESAVNSTYCEPTTQAGSPSQLVGLLLEHAHQFTLQAGMARATWSVIVDIWTLAPA